MRFCILENPQQLVPRQCAIGADAVGLGAADLAFRADVGRNPYQNVTVPAYAGCYISNPKIVVYSQSKKVFLRGGPRNWALLSRMYYFELIFENYPVYHPFQKEIVIDDSMCGLSVNKFFTDVVPGSNEMDRQKEEATEVPLRMWWLPGCTPEAGSSPKELPAQDLYMNGQDMIELHNYAYYKSQMPPWVHKGHVLLPVLPTGEALEECLGILRPVLGEWERKESGKQSVWGAHLVRDFTSLPAEQGHTLEKFLASSDPEDRFRWDRLQELLRNRAGRLPCVALVTWRLGRPLTIPLTMHSDSDAEDESERDKQQDHLRELARTYIRNALPIFESALSSTSDVRPAILQRITQEVSTAASYAAEKVTKALADHHYLYMFQNYTKAQLRFAISEDRESLRPISMRMNTLGAEMEYGPRNDNLKHPVILTLPPRLSDDTPSQKIVYMTTKVIFVRGGPQYWSARERHECYELIYHNLQVPFDVEDGSTTINVFPNQIGKTINKYFREVYETDVEVTVDTVARAGF